MANKSSRLSYLPEARNRLDSQLEFVLKHRENHPKLAKSVAEEANCSTANVYAVFSGRSFNAQIIRISHNQLCRIMGIIDHEDISASNEEDEIGLRYLADGQRLENELQESLVLLRDAQSKVKRNRKDLLRLRMAVEAHLSLSLEDMSDEVSIRLKEYATDRPISSHFEKESAAIDLQEYTSEFTEGMKLLQSFGLVSANGIPLNPDTALALAGGGHTPDGPEVDPMSPGRHVDAEGNEYYVGKD